MKDYNKRFIVLCNGLIMSAFDSVSEAEDYLENKCAPYFNFLAVIYDIEEKREVLTVANV